MEEALIKYQDVQNPGIAGSRGFRFGDQSLNLCLPERSANWMAWVGHLSLHLPQLTHFS
jgi:hypothetical protein